MTDHHSPPSGTVPPGTVSPDGHWRWDGGQWLPNQTNQLTPPTKKKHTGRNVGFGCLGSIVVVILLIVVITISTSNNNNNKQAASSSTSSPTAGAAAAPAACTQPCSIDSNVTVLVSNLVYGADPGEYGGPDPGNVFVTMTVTVTNKGTNNYNLNPFNFQLLDQTGIQHDFFPMLNNQATEWQAVNLTNGASQAETLSFQSVASHPTGMTLIWTANFFSGDHKIKLN